jgi:hypothetical protein
VKIVQPSMNPTNKLSAATISVAVVELSRFLVQHFAPEFYDAGLWSALTPMVVFAVGYFVKDEANIVVVK